jgi:hypothetical protein
MMHIGALMVLLLFAGQARPTIGKVNSTYDKTAAFATFKTWSTVAGRPALNPDAHKIITAAIEAEMTALGLTKVDGRDGDVAVRYLTLRSTSVDLDKLETIEKQGGDRSGAEFTVGRLVIIMDDAKSSRRLWAADSVEVLNPAVTALDQAIKGVVARMFETYPTRQKAK